jgi:hypothetical protein
VRILAEAAAEVRRFSLPETVKSDIRAGGKIYPEYLAFKRTWPWLPSSSSSSSSELYSKVCGKYCVWTGWIKNRGFGLGSIGTGIFRDIKKTRSCLLSYWKNNGAKSMRISTRFKTPIPLKKNKKNLLSEIWILKNSNFSFRIGKTLGSSWHKMLCCVAVYMHQCSHFGSSNCF